MMNDFGDSRVTIKKDELLIAIRKNREAHRSTFLKAIEGYRTQVIEELDRMLSDAKAGKRIKRAIELVEPMDKTKDYDRVIRMLEMSIADEIIITETQFSQYVLDEWGWSAQFVGSTSRYTGS
jgi:predicted HAD superfamily phosphohydrolase YqeG